MKKILSVFIILILFLGLVSITTISSAATLDTVRVETSKTKIAPGEEVKLTVNFGKNLGSYTVNTTYDNNIFEYVRSEGGAENNTGSEVILTYHDTTGGTNPRTNATITFKAKKGLTGTNPTNFSTTLTGMAGPNASERYDDITDAIVKDVLVEPNYVNYTLRLNYKGIIKKDEKKDMTLITESVMGKNYDHVRLTAEVTAKPSNSATAKLLATQSDGNEIDLLETGWGAENGYALGGENVKQELALRGEFNTNGKYTIHIKLVDRDDSDKVITEKSFDIKVGEETKPTTQKPNTTEKLPSNYPQTGTTQYIFIATILVALITMYVVISKIKKNK